LPPVLEEDHYLLLDLETTEQGSGAMSLPLHLDFNTPNEMIGSLFPIKKITLFTHFCLLFSFINCTPFLSLSLFLSFHIIHVSENYKQTFFFIFNWRKAGLYKLVFPTFFFADGLKMRLANHSTKSCQTMKKKKKKKKKRSRSCLQFIA